MVEHPVEVGRGVLADFYWIFGRFQPYVGLTVGGALTHLLMEGDTSRAAADDRSWDPVGPCLYFGVLFYR